MLKLRNMVQNRAITNNKRPEKPVATKKEKRINKIKRRIKCKCSEGY